jgi:hypothetical protein
VPVVYEVLVFVFSMGFLYDELIRLTEVVVVVCWACLSTGNVVRVRASSNIRQSYRVAGAVAKDGKVLRSGELEKEKWCKF